MNPEEFCIRKEAFTVICANENYLNLRWRANVKSITAKDMKIVPSTKTDKEMEGNGFV